MQKKNPAKRRPERLVVTLLSLLFLSTAVFATVKYVFRAPELDTDKPVVTPDGTASADVDRTDTDEPDAPGRTRRKYCYNILVSGLDDDNGGSDTNILVRFDVPNKRIDLVSLPRDTLLHNEYRNNKLNFAYAKGGTELLMEQIENLLGVPVDFYVTVNLKGFIALVDQIDGVDFDIPINMDYDDPYQDLHIHFTKGPRHLNGQEAMEVVRFRHNNDGSGYTDVGRAEMQRQVLVALAKKVVSWNSLTKVQEFVEIFQEYVKTDLSTTDMLYFASQAVGVDLDTGITQGTLEGRGEGVVRGYKYCFVFQAEDILPTLNELVNPYDQPLTEEDLDLPQAEYYWNGTVIN